MIKLLSTKVLSFENRQKITNSSIKISDYNAITIEKIKINIDAKIKNAIFTSKNSVKAIINKNIEIKNCYCVGEKTKSLLLKNGQKVVKCEENALKLANFIVKSSKNDNFSFFCGNMKRDELPRILKKNNIKFSIVEVYKTSFNYKKTDDNYSGILFFSPSAVKSYCHCNKIEDEVLFTIGQTTTNEAKTFTNKIITSDINNIGQVVDNAIKYFTYDKK
ncbi:uroporphyrinogen-III synthase [Flavobacteriaceae bacterium]|jgi:uroporphyrinogen-III synthase|nr:uroporphyrinogen-III synthase [Flavobacteriaceae bacterium]